MTDDTTDEKDTDAKGEQSSDGDSGDGHHSGGSSGKKRVLTAKGAIRRSIEQLEELMGRTPESVIAVDREEDGWKVSLELVESRRIPDTADILAEYVAHVDDRGELTGYRRVARYSRGRVDS
jgi:hypothetical protein